MARRRPICRLLMIPGSTPSSRRKYGGVSRLKRQPARLAAVMRKVPLHRASVTNGTPGTTIRGTKIPEIIVAGAST